MTTATRSRPTKQRTVNVIERGGEWLLIELRIGRQTFYYLVREIEADQGRGFELEKEDGTTYHVNLRHRLASCDCRGFVNHDHCKHVESLAALIDAGSLPRRAVKYVCGECCDGLLVSWPSSCQTCGCLGVLEPGR